MKPRKGDIIEISVKDGFAYALFTHKVKLDGELIRVWSDVHERRPSSFDAIVHSDPSFSCFFPLDRSVSRSLVSIVGHADIPGPLAAFPTFRNGLVGPDRRVSTWWLWDGVDEWKIGDLTEAQRNFPIRGTWTFVLLQLRIEEKWNPRDADF